MGGRRIKPQLTFGDEALDLVLQEFINSLEDELFIVDKDYHIKFVNSAAMQKLAGRVDSPIGRLCYEVFEARDSPCSSPLWLCPIIRVLQSGKTTVIVHPRYPISSDVISNEHMRIAMHPLKDSRGNISAVAELRRDVTAEKEMEHQILKRHHHLQALSRISSATSGLRNLNSILNVCLDIALESVNGEIGGILLFDEQNQRLRYRVSRGLSAKYVEKMKIAPGEGIAGRVLRTGEPILLEDISKDARVAHKDLISTEGLRGFASVPLKARDKVVGVINMASHMPGRFREDDIYLLNSMGCQIGTAIEQARLYERLASAAKRYQTLLRHALNAQEDERKRIARELHDETSQAITSLTLSLQAIISMVEMKDIADQDIIERLRATHAYTVHAGNEIVRLMKELRPTLLDELGMPAAIHRYAKDTLQAQGISVSAEFLDTDRRLPSEIEVTLFRVAQGLIGNILKHSGAKNAVIKLECDAAKCTLKVQDDGKGFDVKKLTRVYSDGRGAGLFTMKERVKLAGGHCKIDSHRGQGTKVAINIPLPADLVDEQD